MDKLVSETHHMQKRALEIEKDSRDATSKANNEKLSEANSEIERLKVENEKLREDKSKVEEIAYVDNITKIPNRRAFDDEMNILEKTNTVFTLLMIDVNRFKSINDQHGHRIGDSVLKDIANSLKENLRPEEFLARIGGDEFAIIIPELTDKNEISERMVNLYDDSTDKEFVYECRNEKLGKYRAVIKPSLSIGVVIREPGETYASVMHRADGNMYIVKKTGMDGVWMGSDFRK